MATTSAIALANNETLNQARQAKAEAGELIEQVKSLHTSLEAGFCCKNLRRKRALFKNGVFWVTNAA